ncbi:MAG: hypothetical protein C0608_04760 [Deltaproteobacteria bacterium]|nr:MAG: hypothetical protein C0608_04760 [Deltaproteobacteria bacterium]
MRGIIATSLLVASLITATAYAQPSAEAVKRKMAGNEYLKRREYVEASKQYQAALKLEPAYSDVHYNLGILYFYRLEDESRRYEKALYHLNAYRLLNPDAEDMETVLAHVRQSLEQIDEAEQSEYQNAILTGTIESLQDFINANPIGYYSEDARRQLKILRDYDAAVKKRQSKIQSLFKSALAAKSPDKMEEFVRLYPDEPQAIEATALAEKWRAEYDRQEADFSMAQKKDSVAAYDAFLEEHPDSHLVPEARARAAHLSSALEALTMAEEAGSVTALEKFLELYGDTPYEVEAIEIIEKLKREEIEKAASKEAMEMLKSPPPKENDDAESQELEDGSDTKLLKPEDFEKAKFEEQKAKKAAEEAEAARVAAEKIAAQKEAARVAAEKKAAEEAEAARIAAEKKAAEEAEAARLAAEKKAEEERIAAEEAKRLEAERAEAERKAAQARKDRELERKRAEEAEAARLEAEKKAAEEAEAARLEAEKKAAEEAEAARLEAEKKATEEAVKEGDVNQESPEETSTESEEVNSAMVVKPHNIKAAATETAMSGEDPKANELPSNLSTNGVAAEADQGQTLENAAGGRERRAQLVDYRKKIQQLRESNAERAVQERIKKMKEKSKVAQEIAKERAEDMKAVGAIQ